MVYIWSQFLLWQGAETPLIWSRDGVESDTTSQVREDSHVILQELETRHWK